MKTRGGVGRKFIYLLSIAILLFVPYFMGVGMSGTGNNYQTTADTLYQAIKSNRNIFESFSQELQTTPQQTTVKEHWLADKTLFLHSQAFQDSNAQSYAHGANYTLQSLWAINQEHFPKSDKEREGLIYVLKNPGENYYTNVKMEGREFFMAVYPDSAVSQACVQCHNSHALSPKTDFQVGDLMGAVVLRIPLDRG